MIDLRGLNFLCFGFLSNIEKLCSNHLSFFNVSFVVFQFFNSLGYLSIILDIFGYVIKKLILVFLGLISIKLNEITYSYFELNLQAPMTIL